MATRTLPQQREDGLGTVTTRIEIENAGDGFRVAAGDIPASSLRAIVVEEVLVDTGATTLCLPQDVIDRLGLMVVRTVDAETASGVYRTSIYEGARISLEGRSGIVECMALPPGSRPLLGVIPLEQLGLEPDLTNQRLRVLPEHGRGSHIRI